MISSKLSKSKLNEIYLEHVRYRILKIGRVGAPVTLAVFISFIYPDLVIMKSKINVFILKFVPIFFNILFLIVIFTRLKESYKAVKISVSLFLFSIMFSISIRVVLLTGTNQFYMSITGLLLAIFVIYSTYIGGVKFYFPILGIPLILMIGYLFIFVKPDKFTFLPFIIPILMTSAAIIMSEIQERLRFRDFSNNVLIEMKNIELKQKNDIIETTNNKLKSELKLARQIQHNLIPLINPKLTDIEISTLYIPMQEVGGDFYDFVKMNSKNELGIFISDVSGHGVPAALITSMVKTLIETAERKLCSPKALLSYVNEKIAGQTNGNFLTAFYGVFDITKKTLKYSRAAHNYPFLIRDNELIELKGNGKILGILDDIEIEEIEIQLNKGDKLLFYTDGLTEAINNEGEDFEGTLINDILISNSHVSITDYVEKIYDELKLFTGEEKFDDDICIIGIELT